MAEYMLRRMDVLLKEEQRVLTADTIGGSCKNAKPTPTVTTILQPNYKP